MKNALDYFISYATTTTLWVMMLFLIMELPGSTPFTLNFAQICVISLLISIPVMTMCVPLLGIPITLVIHLVIALA